MNMDELFKLYGDDKETFIDKAEEAGFEPDEIWDYLYDDIATALAQEEEV